MKYDIGFFSRQRQREHRRHITRMVILAVLLGMVMSGCIAVVLQGARQS